MDVLLDSLSDSTKKQYNTAYKLWWTYCNEHEIRKFEASATDVISFFQDIYQKKSFKYGSFNNIRSALALILPEGLGSNILIRRYLKGISRLRPPRRKYNVTWNPQTLLSYLEKIYPNEQVSLELLTKKILALLAIITAQRFQTLSLIKVENVIFTADGGVQIFVPENIKTSAPGRFQPYLHFKTFHEKPEICLVSALNTYIERTASIREEQEYLILTIGRPHHRATSQTLSRWMKETLSKAGVDTGMFTAYSVRHASTSCAFRGGVPIDVIRNTAGWTKESQTFLKFYNKPINNNKSSDDFAKTILNTVL